MQAHTHMQAPPPPPPDRCEVNESLLVTFTDKKDIVCKFSIEDIRKEWQVGGFRVEVH